MASLTQMTVPFYSAELYLVEHNGQPYTPMRPIVENMGLDWKSQLVKIKQRFNSVVGEITTTGKDGKQYKMLGLPLKKLFGWLMTISPNKVKPEIRETVIKYQNECDDVLWDYWTKGQAIDKRRIISPEQQASLHEIVDRRSNGERKIYAEMWSRHNRHFKIPRYSELLAIHFDDAVKYLEEMKVKGKTEQTPAFKQHQAEAFEDTDVQYIMLYAPKLATMVFDEIIPALRLLESKRAGMLFSYTQEMIVHVNLLNARARAVGITTLNHIPA